MMKRRKVKSQKECPAAASMSGPVITIPVLFFRPSMAAAAPPLGAAAAV